ncbi:hypothetical protein AJ87_03605 [Rhizobium yanglingense]|nr:hypothetical protein AJ87_03605 [Rhizobium yanglingense]
MFFRLGRAAATSEEGEAIANASAVNFPDPTYGHQLQDLAVPGLAAEGKMAIRYAEKTVTLAGGETVSLRTPTYEVKDLAYGPLDPATTISPRVAPAMIGLGLIEAIPAADILAHADPATKMVTAFQARLPSCVIIAQARSPLAASGGRHRMQLYATRALPPSPATSAYRRPTGRMHMGIACRPR